MSDEDPTSLPFRARHRLSHALEFRAIYDARIRKSRGPFIVSAMPNSFAWPRLGLAVSSRVGSAVMRNRWKRMIREAFRLKQHELPRTADGKRYDYIVSVRSSPGQPVWPLAGCVAALVELAHEADKEWARRGRRAAGQDVPGAP